MNSLKNQLQQVESIKKIIIIGIGNTLFSDEGVGVHIIPYLEAALFDYPNIEIIEGSTDGIKLLGPVEEADYLIIVDAINTGQFSDTIITLKDQEIPSYFGIKMSIHQVGFQEVLTAAMLRENLPEKMIMFGIQPQSLKLGLEMSEVVKSKIPELVDKIVNQVKCWSEANESC